MEQELPKNIKKHTEKIIFNNEGIKNVSNYDYSGAFANLNIDNSKSLRDYLENMKVDVLDMDDEEMTFELSGIEAPIANALRRIMIAEIPTLAIEKVGLWQNTSIIHDEVLCHRLGLIPIKVDPRPFLFKKETDDENENNCVKFRLHVKCERKTKYANADQKTIDSLPPEEVYTNTTVYSKSLEWIPLGNQKDTFKDDPPRPVHGNIIIAKLRENQEIEAELKCEKGKGKTHAKWTPVSTAFYRLKPDIEITTRIAGEDAHELVETCPCDVFDIEDLGKKGGGKVAVVKDSMKCTMCRECIRNEKFTDKIELGKKRDCYIFTIESVGILKPWDIFKEALRELREKCQHHLSFFEKKKQHQ